MTRLTLLGCGTSRARMARMVAVVSAFHADPQQHAYAAGARFTKTFADGVVRVWWTAHGNIIAQWTAVPTGDTL